MRWTEEEVNQLSALYADHYAEHVAEVIGRSVNSVYNKAFAMELKKSESFLQMEKKIQADRLRIIGADSRYPKGNEPANKGKKMDAIVYEKCKDTMFKKGQRPATAHDIGTITTRKDKSGKEYQFISLSEGKNVPLHVHMWITNKGAIPKGHIIRFIDGNTMNCIIDNLMCISRSENMKMNSYHRFGTDIAKAIQLSGALTRQIRKRIKQSSL